MTSNLLKIFPAALFIVFFSMCVPANANANTNTNTNNPVYQPGFTEHVFSHDGVERWYRIYIPGNFSIQKDSPDNAMVVLLHGGTQSMRKLFSRKRGATKTWVEIAERENFMLLVPNGVNARTGDAKGDNQSWNDGRVKVPRLPETDDVGFITSLIEQTRRTYEVSSDRVFITGSSNGGMMTYRMVIERPELFAAAASAIANLPEHFVSRFTKPENPPPILIMVGTKDPLMPFEGGNVARTQSKVLSSRATLKWWLDVHGLSSDPLSDEYLPDTDKKESCRVRKQIFGTSKEKNKPENQKTENKKVTYFEMQGGGHNVMTRKYPIRDNFLTRSLLGPVCRDAEGAELIWAFFSEAMGKP